MARRANEDPDAQIAALQAKRVDLAKHRHELDDTERRQRSVLELGLVDQLEVAIIPVLLGDGLPLLPRPGARAQLKLTGQKLFKKTGTLMLNYEVKRARKS